jgi:isoquinoline 1-oxidoreductase/isoquinoline 1-oxidoreductase beta subunit
LLAGAAGLSGAGLLLYIARPEARDPPIPGAPDGLSPNAWLLITPDDRILLQVDRMEIGQGVTTGFVTLLAEELDVPPARIETAIAPVHPRFQDPVQLTGGSESMRQRWLPIRETGARARRMLLRAAAERWNVPLARLTTDGDGSVIDADSGKVARYGELALAAADLPLPDEVTLREPRSFRYIGTDVLRTDVRPKITGSARYGLDVRLPGQLTAVITRPPRLRDHGPRFDPAPALAIPGVQDVFAVASGVAVVATDFWTARRGANALAVTWTDGPLIGVYTDSIHAAQRQILATDRVHEVRDEGDIAAVPVDGWLDAEYRLPYLAHATLEPMNATVWFRDGVCEAWVPTQGPDLARQAICAVSGLSREQVTVHATWSGGGFGRRATVDYVSEAAEIAWRVRKPVQLVWTREDDIRAGTYREATLHRLRGRVNTDGGIDAWHHRLVAASLNPQVFPVMLDTVAPEWLPGTVRKAIAGVSVRAFDYLVGSFAAREGAGSIAYAIPNLRVDLCEWNPGVPITIWRSVGHSYTCFVIESFIDELATAAQADPAEFRRRQLAGKPRHLAVLELVLEKSGWVTPPPGGRFRGLAVQECFGSVVAEVAEVSVTANGDIRVHRVICAVDCGTAINPGIVRQQMEGGILFGLTAALHGEITLEDGIVQQSNFHDYRMLRLADAPAIDVHIVPSEASPSGVGEPAVPPIAPAVANAVFAATGRRLRSLPLRLAR